MRNLTRKQLKKISKMDKRNSIEINKEFNRYNLIEDILEEFEDLDIPEVKVNRPLTDEEALQLADYFVDNHYRGALGRNKDCHPLIQELYQLSLADEDYVQAHKDDDEFRRRVTGSGLLGKIHLDLMESAWGTLQSIFKARGLL